ncbi:Phthiocerol/phthiodiolone dimycocerosyl transferase [Dirofilaria immitis]
MSCATKHAVTHWNKFMNYRVMNSHTGTLMDDHPCESPHNQTCNGLCYIFQISGINKVDGTKQFFAMAQGCSVGLFDNSARCFDRPIIWRGRGGNFNLDGHYCLCDGDLCNRNSEKFVQYDAKNFYTQRQKAESINREIPIGVIAISIIYLVITPNG